MYTDKLKSCYEDILKIKSSNFTSIKKEFNVLLTQVLEENKVLVKELNMVHRRYAEVFQRLDQNREEEITVQRMAKDIAERSKYTCKNKLDEKRAQIVSLQQQMNELKVCFLITFFKPEVAKSFF